MYRQRKKRTFNLDGAVWLENDVFFPEGKDSKFVDVTNGTSYLVMHNDVCKRFM